MTSQNCISITGEMTGCVQDSIYDMSHIVRIAWVGWDYVQAWKPLTLVLYHITGHVCSPCKVNPVPGPGQLSHPSKTCSDPPVPAHNPCMTHTYACGYRSMAGMGAGQPSDTWGLTHTIA